MKGAIFDMDGTLFDTEKIYQEGWLEVGKKYVESVDPTLPLAICGTADKETLEIIHRYYPEVDAKSYLQDVLDYYNVHVKEGLSLKKGAFEILNYFKNKNMKIAIASSSTKQQIISNLKQMEIYDYFDAIVSADDVENGKPFPDIFLKASEELHLHSEECYVFEDAINGVKAGLNAKCKTIMIPESQAPLDYFYEECYGIYESLLDVIGIED